MVTLSELRAVMPHLTADRANECLGPLTRALAEFEINSYLREAAFLAQLAHESCEFRYFEELASGAEYEGRADLGNTVPGFGRRYKGRGPLQLTGYANYLRYGKILNLDLVNHPELAATLPVCFRIAGLFWKLNGLNALADTREFKKITRRINGGYNHLAERIAYYETALRVLSQTDPPTPLVVETQDDEGVSLTVLDEALVVDEDRTPGYLETGVVWVPLRATTEKLGWGILQANGTQATIRINDGIYTLPMEIHGPRGYVPARRLAEAGKLKVTFAAGHPSQLVLAR